MDKAAEFDEKIVGLRAKRLELFCNELIPELEKKNYNITSETIGELLNSLEVAAYAAEKGINLSKDMIDDYINKTEKVSVNKVMDEAVPEKNQDKENGKTESVKEEVFNRFGGKSFSNSIEI